MSCYCEGNWKGVYVTIVNSAFCLFFYLTGVHFQCKLQHGGNVSQKKIKCRPIRTREIGGVSLSDVLYVGEDRNIYILVYPYNIETKSSLLLVLSYIILEPCFTCTMHQRNQEQGITSEFFYLGIIF